MLRDLADLHIAVLAGGPDAERAVSIASASAVAEALGESQRFREVSYVVIDRLNQAQVAQIDCDLFFPVLHGPWGEGGPLQSLLEKAGRPFVGSGSDAARTAMDKSRAKNIASALDITVADSYEIDKFTCGCGDFDGSVVIKPVDDGSSFNIFICHTVDAYRSALHSLQRQYEDASRLPPRFMVERFVPGRELTVSVIGDEVSSIIEIIPNTDFYDYEAKYDRDDTTYTVNPDLPEAVRRSICEDTLRLFRKIGARDLARVDFRYDDENPDLEADQACYFLEINTMPGFTAHSLLPMGAKRMQHWDMAELCVRLVTLALDRAK